jgi:DNA invertase Pin-like site-specific DNA recombinase
MMANRKNIAVRILEPRHFISGRRCPDSEFLFKKIKGLQIKSCPFASRRENIDTSGPMGRLFLTLISSIAELESDLIRERVKAGMRRAKLEGRQIGRARLDINREQVVDDRRSGMSLTVVAKRHSISRASVCRLMK